jgi:hypothetical protein
MPHFTDFSTFPIRDHFSKYYKTKISILFWNFSPHLKIPIRITLSFIYPPVANFKNLLPGFGALML